MAIKSPIKELAIKKESSGFYQGNNKVVALLSKILIGTVVVLAAISPEETGKLLSDLQAWIFQNFNGYYTYATAFYILVCIVLALVPIFGKIKLGQQDGKPEFSNFSWFSMMFGAGIGIGMLSYSAAEPVWHLSNNPAIMMSKDLILSVFSSANISLAEGADVFAAYRENVASGIIAPIDGIVFPGESSAVIDSFRYAFLHWGIAAWSTYALAGICIGFFTYNRGLPLTIRSSLTPLFGKKMEGGLGNAIDILAIIATIFGVAQTIGLGLSTFTSGLYNITGAEWLMTPGDTPEPTIASLLLCLFIIMSLSMLSALSGVGRGIKWLSNLNMVLSIVLLAFFFIFGSTLFALEVMGKSVFSYVVNLPAMTLVVWDPSSDLGSWQTSWSVFYWAWWIAFSPFVGVFLARVSKNRTIREFVLGAILAPTTISIAWFVFVGGTAIDLELTGIADGRIFNAGLTSQIYEIVNVLMSPAMAGVLSAIIIVLLLTYQITSADSAVLVVKIISTGGDVESTNRFQIIIWSVLLTGIITVLLLAGGLSAITSAMIIGALPFSFILVLMGVSLVKALYRDYLRKQ